MWKTEVSVDPDYGYIMSLLCNITQSEIDGHIDLHNVSLKELDTLYNMDISFNFGELIIDFIVLRQTCFDLVMSNLQPWVEMRKDSIFIKSDSSLKIQNMINNLEITTIYEEETNSYISMVINMNDTLCHGTTKENSIELCKKKASQILEKKLKNEINQKYESSSFYLSMEKCFIMLYDLSCIDHTIQKYRDRITFDISKLEKTIQEIKEFFDSYPMLKIVCFNDIRIKYYEKLNNHFKDDVNKDKILSETFIFVTKGVLLPMHNIEDMAVLVAVLGSNANDIPQYHQFMERLNKIDSLKKYFDYCVLHIKEKYRLDPDNIVVDIFVMITVENDYYLRTNPSNSDVVLYKFINEPNSFDMIAEYCLFSPIPLIDRLDYCFRLITKLKRHQRHFGPFTEQLLKSMNSNNYELFQRMITQLYNDWRYRIEIQSELMPSRDSEYISKVRLSKILSLKAKLNF